MSYHCANHVMGKAERNTFRTVKGLTLKNQYKTQYIGLKESNGVAVTITVTVTATASPQQQ